ncbi:MAG: hypothetical protein J5944_09620, partial [Lentisphaeria bacterium]|nr:hypothetical protein [Lentisphaeria bacterium]
MGDTTYHYTHDSYWYYDETLTQSLLNQYVSTIVNSSATHQVWLNNRGTMSAWTGSKMSPAHSQYEYEDSVSHPSTRDDLYENFTAAVNVDFAAAWSAASAVGSAALIPNGITLADDDTYATNITFARDGVTYAEGNNTRLTDITYSSGGSVWLGNVYGREEWVVLSSTGLGEVGTSTTVYYATTGQKLNGLRAKQDFGELILLTGASASATDVVVSRNMRELDIANDSGYGNLKNKTGNGTVVDSVTVSGKLDRVHVGSGASLNMLTVGTQRNFTSADRSAFGYYDSNWGSWTYSSATIMQIASGGTASNIYLNNGGQVIVFGPEDRVSSSWNSTTQQWEVTTSYASGAGGTLTNLQMAVSGGLVFDGISDPSATWENPQMVYLNSSSYLSHFRVTAPQSAYVEFQSNTSGSNVTIGNGGSMRIGKGASVVGISM